MSGHLTRRFWKALPPRPFATFLAAVFFTFSAFGFLRDVMAGGQLPAGELAFLVALCGSVAAGFAWSMTKHRALLPAVLLLQLVGLGLQRPIQDVWGRLSFDAIATSACLVAGYVFFVVFIAGEGGKAMRLQTEIGLAQEIHALLAPPLALGSEVCDVAGRSMPTSEVGGDLLDVVVRDGCTTSYVVDVSGHGVPAGSLMGMIKSAARMRLLSSPPLGALLTDLNRIVFDVKKPNMFATAACLTVRGQGRAGYALAGHLPLLHYRAATGRVDRLGEGQTALGLIEGQAFAETAIAVGTGDVLALVTDGLTEVQNAAEQELGLEPIEQALAEHAGGASLDALLDLVFESARRHGAQVDDQTVLLVRIR